MKKGIFAVALIAALALVGTEAQEAEAGTPFFVQIGGPRARLSIGSNYGYGGGGGYYRRQTSAYPYGVTRGYSNYPRQRRYRDVGYGRGGYGGGGYGGGGYGGYGGGGYGGGCYR